MFESIIMMPLMSLRTARDAACLNNEVARRQTPLPPIAIVGIFGTSRWQFLSMLPETVAVREAVVVGPSRHFAATQQFGRSRGEADTP
jgi:hypothetical protein